VLESHDFTSQLATLGAERIGGTAEQFATFFKNEVATWSAIIKAEGIKVE
jgi:tripartite-type tricarboxylate transporter receptor subunit TctC